MQKITLLLSTKLLENALIKLRKLGVLHINYVKNPLSESIDSIKTEITNVEKTLHIIGDANESTTNIAASKVPDYIKQILDLVQEKSTLTNELEEQRVSHRWFETWGAISYSSIQALREAGVYIRLYNVNKKALKKLPPAKNIHIIKEEKGIIFLAFFAESPEDKLDFREEQIPKVEFNSLKLRIKDLEKRITEINNILKSLVGIRNYLIAYKIDLEKKLEFNNVLHGMGDEEHFAYLQGFCPIYNVPKIKKTADREDWAYIIQEPIDSIDVPTLIRNPKWLRIIDPLFKFMGSLPGYNEHDISFWFLLFFSFFFAMLIGDAGYGLIFLGLTFFASKKAKRAPREPFRLMYVLSSTTILWGIISGNWFGYEKIAQMPFISSLVIDQVNSFTDTNQLFMMFLCFMIGLIHLSVAHAMNAFKIINSPKALAEIGWIAILWTLFFVAGNLVLEKPVPKFTEILFISGIVLTLIFTNFRKNIFKGIGITMGNLPLSIISSFSDIVSYLRLFAVGYASVTVAASFNNIALDAGFHSVLNTLIAAVILFLGHSLNIMLGLMSVIVHGIRLNMLEFSGHLNMQWSGKDYKPFKE